LATVAKLCAPRRLAERRKIGAFYTPDELSQILADWAIRQPTDTVLEPSFGGCGFLEAARKSLQRLGSDAPAENIFGCDIDPVAFQHLSALFREPVDLDQFQKIDFLDCKDIRGWPTSFTAILANPPYIPHQRIGQERQKELAARRWGIPNVGGRASLWAYFLAHSVSLLGEGGRMAWVLPGATLQADYASAIRDYLAKHFDRCAAIVVRERLFLAEGADEETVILLAEGHRKLPRVGAIELAEAQTLVELSDLIERWRKGEWQGNVSGVCPAALSLTERSLAQFEALALEACCQTIGEIAKVQIGIVTGANPFFILPRDELAGVGLEGGDCAPILAKFRQAPGLTFTRTDHEAALEQGGRAYLVDTRETLPNVRIEAYLATFNLERREEIGTFRKRAIWHQPCDGKFPDAFLPVMHHHGPRLVLNTLGCNSTNTVHRVVFHDGVSPAQRKLLAISLLTTFAQISAELVGRRYGSGVLKHEPRDAERIQVLMPDIPVGEVGTAFGKIDGHLRAGQAEEATDAANQLVLSHCAAGDGLKNLKEMKAALLAMRARRRPSRRTTDPDS
jgi:adenine-specific DNA-methyltransferase